MPFHIVNIVYIILYYIILYYIILYYIYNGPYYAHVLTHEIQPIGCNHGAPAIKTLCWVAKCLAN